MKMARRVLFAAATFLLAGPAMAQYYPNNPPPPPPPQYYPPPPPTYYQPPPPAMESARPEVTIRASGGVSFIGAGYYCGYYYHYYPLYTCGVGYATAFPEVNLDIDVWVKPRFGLTIGADVMWGTYTPSNVGGGVPNVTTYTTIWEPHVDFLFAPTSNQQVKTRVRAGLGLYVSNVNNGSPGSGITPYSYNNLGAALRIGFGVSLFAKSKVGIGLDAIYEAGWIGSEYVSTVQLLVGPELHF